MTEPLRIPFLSDSYVELLVSQRDGDVDERRERARRSRKAVEVRTVDYRLRALRVTARVRRWWDRIRGRVQPVDMCIAATIAMILIVLAWSSYDPAPTPVEPLPGEIVIEVPGYTLG